MSATSSGSGVAGVNEVGLSASGSSRPVLLGIAEDGSLETIGMSCEDDLQSYDCAVLRGDVVGEDNFLIINEGTISDIARQKMQEEGVDVDSCIVQQGGEESDAFWDVFDLGSA